MKLSKPSVAFFLSADSFEGFYGGIFGLNRQAFLASYRNDFVWEYANGLCALGHRIVIYVLSYGSPELHVVSEGLSVRFIKLPKWLRFVEPVTYRLSKIAVFSAIRDTIAYLGYRRQLKVALAIDLIEVLYHQEVWTSRYDIISKEVRIPIVAADHGALYRSWMRAAKRVSLPRASLLTFQSFEILNLAKTLGGHAELLSNAVDTNYFSPGDDKQAIRPKVILSVGRLVEEQKRHVDLIKALKYLPDFKLIIVGSGPAEALLVSTVRKLNLETRVRFVKFISDRAELRRLYRECGVFVCSSAWEAMALVVLEAMSCEVPVVCTRIPSFEDLIVHGINGLLIPIGSPEQIAEAVKIAIGRAEELGTRARVTIMSRFSSEQLYSKLSKLIADVARQEHRG